MDYLYSIYALPCMAIDTEHSLTLDIYILFENIIVKVV
jgi:hypothetical protein